MQWGRLEYFIPAEGLTWASVFGTLERSRQHLPIEDYSVTQTTLERVSDHALGEWKGELLDLLVWRTVSRVFTFMACFDLNQKLFELI